MAFDPIEVVNETGSTNNDLMAALSSEPDRWPHLSALVAKYQRDGRGRLDRHWVSPAGAGLTVSIVIDPPDGMPLTLVPLLVGIAVRDAITPWVNAALKWPNDIVVPVGKDAEEKFQRESDESGDLQSDRVGYTAARSVSEGEPRGVNGPHRKPWTWGKKLGGVLCELHPSGAVVAGIGLNCLQDGSDLPVSWATSLSQLLTTNHPALAPDAASAPEPTPAVVLELLGLTVPEVLRRWAADPDALLREYDSLNEARGKIVRVEGAETIEGTSMGVNAEGYLRVRTPEGERLVTSGDLIRLS